MRWGLFGKDARLIDWLQRFARSPAVPAFLGVRQAPEDDAMYHGLPRVEFCAGWEPLLVAQPLDAILASGYDAAALDGMRQLSQASVPLYVRPHAAQGLSFAYELTLAAAERSNPIRPLWTHRSDTALASARQWLSAHSVTATHVELERRVEASTYPPGDIDLHLSAVQLDDFDLLAWFGVKGSRITALTSPRPDPRQRRSTVTIESEAGPYGMWTCETHSTGPSTSRLTIQTEQGPLVLEQSGAEPWRIAAQPAEVPLLVPALFDDQLTWEQAVGMFEWADGVERSLERRRAIELHSEPLSERTIFKTQMAALGCFLLLGTLALGVGYLLIAALLPLPEGLLRVVRLLVFAPLFIFLLAQLLLPLSRGSRS